MRLAGSESVKILEKNIFLLDSHSMKVKAVIYKA